ncbi:hypothetical protein KUTeg_014985 [Tegillarca granosa]|uniref:WD repeat-containing protein 60 n=1 Tax=Tegillarca granosa TaxID=220873 RepID=A0ABQ9ERA3_TEGGR|nr:hypothetical protein KUTeg_014985 [Tegillarca granosa]
MPSERRDRPKDDRDQRRRHRDEVNGDDRHRRRRDDDEKRHHRDDDRRSKDEDRRKKRDRFDSPERVELTEEERERQRRERRAQREGKGKENASENGRTKEEKNRHNRIEDDDERPRHRRDDDGDKRRRHKDEDDDDRDRRKREEERERRRKEAEEKDKRRKQDDGKEKRRHDDDRERRHKDDDRDRRKKDRDDDDREKRRHRDDDDREKRRHRDDDDREKRRHRDVDDDRDKRRHREDDREKRRHRDDDDREKRRHRDDGDREKRRHRDDDDREKRQHRDEDDEEERERQRRERREKREGKSKDSDRDKYKDKREERRRKEDEEDERILRRGEKESKHSRDKYNRDSDEEEVKSSSRAKSAKKVEVKEDDYNYEDDEFEVWKINWYLFSNVVMVTKSKLFCYFSFQLESLFAYIFHQYQRIPAIYASIITLMKARHGKTSNSCFMKSYCDNEMNDILRALDQENDRLIINSRQRDSPDSPVDNRHRHGHRDYRDDRDDSPEPERPKGSRSRTMINFVSAKQRVMTQKAASKMGKRATDLKQMIELDVASFDLFDMPPVKEYDLYIRSFGRTDTTQTNDDNVDRDIQTDEIDTRQKWTQHPAEDYVGCGRGDGEKDLDEEEQAEKLQKPDVGRLDKFVRNAGQVISILLEEERASYKQTDINDNKSHIISDKGIVCVWNTNDPSYPQRILACESQPTCCCFSPYKASVAFAGMVDGSICVWDLREPSSLHRSVNFDDTQHLLRFPTYNTAGIVEIDNHHSCVTTLNPIVSYSRGTDKDDDDASEDLTSGMSFQLVSSESHGLLNFWVVAEIAHPDMAGSEMDLGLSPGGRVKLVKSSFIKLDNPQRDGKVGGNLRTFEMQISPYDPNHYYVGTDLGSVLHGLRFGSRAYPYSFSSTDAPVDVFTVDFSPFGHPCFLVSCSDSTVHLYGIKTDKPLVSWYSRIWGGNQLLCARWSRSRPCVFYVLDEDSNLYIFDLLENDVMPSKVEKLSKERVMHISFTSEHKSSGLARSPKMEKQFYREKRCVLQSDMKNI